MIFKKNKGPKNKKGLKKKAIHNSVRERMSVRPEGQRDSKTKVEGTMKIRGQPQKESPLSYTDVMKKIKK
jgi:hypothetical protein